MMTVEVELVGGPCDGERVFTDPNAFFVYIERAGVSHVYGMGDDGKYHYCPEILSDETA